MTILECVHQHISEELRQAARTDTILVVTVLCFDLLAVAINSVSASFAKSNRRGSAEEAVRRLELYNETCRGQDPSRSSNWGRRGKQDQDRYCSRMDRQIKEDTANDKGGIGLFFHEMYLILFIAMTFLINAVSVAALNTNRDSRSMLLKGLVAMYTDENVDKYYDISLLQNSAQRYLYFELVIFGLASMAILVPLSIRM